TIHRQIPGGPNRGCADVVSEHRVIASQLTGQPRNVFRPNRSAVAVVDRQIIERLAGLAVVLERAIQVVALRYLGEQRLPRGDRVLYGAHQSEINVGASADVAAVDVDLNDR